MCALQCPQPSQRNSGLRSLAVGATWKALGVIGWVLNALLWAAKDTGLSWGDLRRKATPAPEPFRPR